MRGLFRKDKLLNDYNSLLKKVKGELDTIETYDKLVKEKDKLANLEKDITSALSVLNKQQKEEYTNVAKEEYLKFKKNKQQLLVGLILIVVFCIFFPKVIKIAIIFLSVEIILYIIDYLNEKKNSTE